MVFNSLKNGGTLSNRAVRRIVVSTLAAVLVAVALSPFAAAPRAQAIGPLPAGLPNHFTLGVSNMPNNIDWMTNSGVPWDMRYQYLSGGANTGDGWATWNANGDFATYYMNNSAARGYMPVFNYYQLLTSLPHEGADEGDQDYNNLNNPSTMNAYFADFRLLLDKARAFGKLVIVHIEGDLFGYMHNRVVNTTNSAASISAAVAASGYPDAQGLPNTFQGWNWTLLRMRDRYAPNVILAQHVSAWSTGYDLGTNSSSTLDVASIGQKTAAFHNTAGIVGNAAGVSSYDLLFFDPSDRDAAWYQYVQGDGGHHWWDTTNQRFPNFARYEQYIKAVTSDTNRRAILWQVPIGNTIYRTENNTDGHYQDNRVQYWLGGYPNDGRLQALANAGVIGILFGRGTGGQTTYFDDKRDGITNPAPINGNDAVAQYPDDDGGYLRIVAGRYYQNGAYQFGTSAPPTSTPIPSATVTQTAAPTATKTPVPTATKTPAPTATQSPVPTATTPAGNVIPLPGRFEAENYRAGGEGVGYHDATVGNAGGAYRTDNVDIETCSDGASCYDVGYVEAGEWLAYDINVTTSGSYVFSTRVAATASGASFHVEVDGANVSGPIAVPNTGDWDRWSDALSKTVSLTAGRHTLKLVADTTGFNWNNVTVSAAAVPTATQTPAPTATTPAGNGIALPGRFEAEDYRSGGEGVGYHDTTDWNRGHAYRNDGVDIEPCSDGSPCYDVGFIEAGEWLAYDVNVTTTRGYVFTARVATINSGKSFHIEVDGVNVSGPIAVPNTGDWDRWSDVASKSITLSAGRHTLKLVADANDFNWNYIAVR